MKKDYYFWYSLPLFLMISGNFSPFRVGPVLPVYFLFLLYTVLNINIVINFFVRNKISQICGIVFIPYFLICALRGIREYGIKGDEFYGAIDPLLYSSMTFFRCGLAICFIVVIANKHYPVATHIYRAIATCYLILFLTLILQAALYYGPHIEFGYVYGRGGGARFGGLIGEPQTISAWLFSMFFILYLFQPRKDYFRGRYGRLLVSSQLLTLALTQSAVWIIALWFFLFIHSDFRSRIALVGLSVAMIQVMDFTVLNKIHSELFQISERSVTVVSGYELFSENLKNILFGYGFGLSPFVIPNTDIISFYQDLNLSSFGRQNVMNSYLEMIFELGVIGAMLLLSIFYVAIGSSSVRVLVQVLPLLIGISSVGGGFFSGYFILALPLCVRLVNLSRGVSPGLPLPGRGATGR